MKMLSISDEHKEAIIRLVNLVIDDSPTITNLTDRAKVTIKLVKLIDFFQNSVHCDEKSILLLRCLSFEQLIENWLLHYYCEESVMSSFAIEDGLEQELSTACLLVLYVIFKFSICLPHIVMYFNDNWSHLQEFNSQLDQMLNTETINALLDKQIDSHLKTRSNQINDREQSSTSKTDQTNDSQTETLIPQMSSEGELFQCEHCHRLFANKYKLKRHEFVHKPQSKPYKCIWEGCEQRFRATFDMKRHLVTHTGERPFGCHKCDKRFTRSDKLKEHLKLHTRDEIQMMKTEEMDANESDANDTNEIDWSLLETNRVDFSSLDNTLDTNLALFKTEYDF